MRIASFPSPDGFCLRPFLFNGIKIRTVGRQELDGVSLLCDGGDDIRSFVKRGTIENDDGTLWRYRQEGVPHPTKEDVGINIAVPEIHRQKCERCDGTDGIQTSFCMPVPLPVAARTYSGIAMCPRRIDRKAALVQVHDWTLLNVLVPPDSRLELQTMNYVSFGMKQSFFYS